MNDLLTTPLSQPDDLGKPIPEWPHATSVCMPKWTDNIDYEEGCSRVVNKLTCGYPRFVYHPFVKKLFAQCRARFADKQEDCIALPSKRVAERCQQYLLKNGFDAGIHSVDDLNVFCVTFPGAAANIAACFWQHSGEGISSRQAYSLIEHKSPNSDGTQSKQILRERIAGYVQCSPDHVFLFPSGMSAIFNVFQILKTLFPGRKSVQFGFPYVDTLKIQQKFGDGVLFFSDGGENDIKALAKALLEERVMGIFCEFPMNPLIKSPNLNTLANIAAQHGIPLIVDDTLSTFHNVQVHPPADVLVTSLTKFFSGAGDVMGGAVVVKPETEVGTAILENLSEEYEDRLWAEDAGILERNSRDFSVRMNRINSTTETLCDVLKKNPFIDQLFYPKFTTCDHYNAFKKPGRGYSGVFSIVVKNAANNTAKFFDSLMISKGPSLGTNFSLACPYTILAHYHEIDFVTSHGVSKELIRVSVGLEEADDLISRFNQALTACAS